MKCDIIVERPIEDVFHYYADVANFAQWSEAIYRVEREDDAHAEPRVGEVFTVYLAVNGVELTVPHTVEHYERDRQFSYSCKQPIPCRWDVRFDAVDSGTRITITMEMHMDSGNPEIMKRLPPREALETKERTSLQAVKRILESPAD
ncbi:SRPBCC family protein [Haliangium ochraceum]|uniref:Cyclase/dehydrase n=1 Tax=Haliangium ochraceum (strain DSM 14365 / JCM 11303 / SMP-2) TaxID=502025 RepID=D0LP62_HALO1|nr:SRPBCC family protein [Haliangium ochraceum]ACY13427.1 hypothetical protein Hoch_0811 [Haliangium ochraceum DSM 14365]